MDAWVSARRAAGIRPSALRRLGFAAGLAGVLGIVSGCTGAAPAQGVAFELVLSVSEAIPTVFTATWTVDAAERNESWLEVGRDGTWELRVDGVPGDDGYSAWLLGLKPETAYDVRPATSVDGAIVTGEPISITTGGRPPTLPEVAIEGESLSSGGFVVTSMVASPSAAVILDGDGDYVWWHVFDDPEYLISSVELSTDRRWMLVLLERPGGFCHGFARVRLDGAVEEIQLLDDAHHDFAELGEGATALLRWDNRTIDADIVRGDRISELGADGSLTDVWSLWDQREPDPALIGGELGDWGHSNHLVLGGDGESYYVSIRNLSAILKIDRATGGIAWQLGGDEGSLAFPDGEKPFIHQHGFDLTESGLVLFDNGDELAGTSRVVEIAIDEEHGTAEVVWTHAAEPPQFCYALGDVQRLPAGNTLVAWSVLGRIEEVTPDHEMLWRADLSMGGGVGYVTWLESLYPAVDAGSGD